MRSRIAAVLGLTVVLAAGLAGGASIDTADRCSERKIKAVLHAVKLVARCHEMTLKRGKTSNQTACVEKANSELARWFQRAEERGGCATVGDASVISAQITGFIAGAYSSLRPAPTPTPTASPAASATPAGSPSSSSSPASAPAGVPSTVPSSAPSPTPSGGAVGT